MKLLRNFIQTNINLIVIGFLVLLLLRSCNSDSKTLNKKIDRLSAKIDSLQGSAVTKTELTIEGLRVEKRMIQSTDRKMIDVQRQSDIDNEIKKLEK
jgi:hypothetical protein